jgi:arsenate reductase-like glutaredoxin family protein
MRKTASASKQAGISLEIHNMAKQPNYTDEQVTQMQDMYSELGNDGLETIAETLGKTVRSVRAKLVRDSVYVAPEKGVATVKDTGPSKKEILRSIDATGFNSEGFQGSTKDALARLLSQLTD